MAKCIYRYRDGKICGRPLKMGKDRWHHIHRRNHLPISDDPRYGNHGRPWLIIEIEQLKNECKEGHSITEISIRHKRMEEAIQHKIVNLNLTIQKISENEKAELARNQKCYEMKSYIEYLGHNTNRYDEIEKYNGWLKWWIDTPIEEIIKIKGDYKLWCTSICTPIEEETFKREVLYKQEQSIPSQPLPIPPIGRVIIEILCGILVIVIAGLILYFFTGKI